MPADSDTERARQASRFFSRPEQYLTHNTDLRVRGRLVEPVVDRLDPLHILDLGAGDGSISLRFRDRARVTLVDRSPEMIERALATLGPDADAVEHHISDIDAFEPAGAYDLVLCLGVIAHAASPETIVAKVATCVRPGGHAIIQVTDSDKMVGKLLRAYATLRDRLPGQAGYQTTVMTVDELVAIGARYDLQCQEVIRYFPAPPGTRFVPSRWVEQAQLLLSERLGWLGSEALLVFSKQR